MNSSCFLSKKMNIKNSVWIVDFDLEFQGYVQIGSGEGL